MADINAGTLYELNKTLVEQNEKVLNKKRILEKKEIIKNFLKTTNNKYYMLLCNEKKDYTIFTFLEEKSEQKLNQLVSILVDECLTNRGKIKGIDVTKDQDAIEIWLSIDKDSYAYYFFPYDAAIIEI